MTKTTLGPTFETLQRLAKTATDEVRADAAKDGSLLPVWRDGRVVLMDPASGLVVAAAAHADLAKLKAQLRVSKPRSRQLADG